VGRIPIACVADVVDVFHFRGGSLLNLARSRELTLSIRSRQLHTGTRRNNPLALRASKKALRGSWTALVIL
jgi:hypothetical protein